MTQICNATHDLNAIQHGNAWLTRVTGFLVRNGIQQTEVFDLNVVNTHVQNEKNMSYFSTERNKDLTLQKENSRVFFHLSVSL